MESSLFKSFSSLNLSEMDFTELEDVTIALTKKFIQNSADVRNGEGDSTENLLNCIKHLKISCSKGPSFQNLIVNTNGLLESLDEILQNDRFSGSEVRLKSFQLLANLCVKNEKSQTKIWRREGERVIAMLKSRDENFSNVAAMIIYNIVLGLRDETIDLGTILSTLLDHYDNFLKGKITTLPDFLHILLDYFLCSNETTAQIYDTLSTEKQRVFLFYVNDHIENDSSEAIHKTLLTRLTLDFKKTSDCVLKTIASYVEAIDPGALVALLDIISNATAREKYLEILRDDGSLFLNIGCLLQALHKAGNESKNAFSPIQKLEQLTPNSNESADFEKEISFSFKTKLVKSLANLCYRNKRNQELAREMEIMSSVFECTNADARNPLIKEWSILAIRNLCEDNSENQEIVKNLTRVGDAPNPILSELGLSDGIVRIKKT